MRSWTHNDSLTHAKSVGPRSVSGVRRVRARGQGSRLCATAARAAYEKERGARPGAHAGLAEFLIGHVAAPEVGPLRVSKRTLAEKLSERILDDLREHGQMEACARRPFLAHMLAVLRMT